MTFQLFTIVIVIVFQKFDFIDSFLSPPASRCNIINSRSAKYNTLSYSVSSSSLLLESEIDVTENIPSGFENAFQDEIVLFDPTVQLFAIGFGIIVTLGIAAKFLTNQLDKAIERVLLEFEATMKSKYESRWVSIEAKLDGLVEPERSQKLFAIMEELQASEPDFMAQVNREMGP